MGKYYDCILVGIPVTYGSMIMVLTAIGVARPAAIVGGTLAASILVAHALFVHPPSRRPGQNYPAEVEGATPQTGASHPVEEPSLSSGSEHEKTTGPAGEPPTVT